MVAHNMDMRLPILLKVDKEAQVVNQGGHGDHELLYADRVHEPKRQGLRDRAPLAGLLEEEALRLGRFSRETQALEPLSACEIPGREAGDNIGPRGAGTKN